MVTAKMQTKKRDIIEGDDPRSVLPVPAKALQRKSFSRNFGRMGTVRIPPSEGTTGALNDLLDTEHIMKGLFGFNDLSSFGESGSFTLSIQGGDAQSRQVIQPVFPFKQLTNLYLTSTTLRECIQAYVRNIESYGHRVEYVGREGGKDSAEAVAEKEQIDALLATIVQNGETITQARENSRIDKEVVGARAFEILEDAAGRVVGIKRIPTNTLLLTRLDKEPTLAQIWNPVTRKYEYQMRRFRRYAQRTDSGRMLYFKEFGDPRTISPETGNEDPSLSIEEEATSIWYDRYYTPGSPYGTPQWASSIPAMVGAREAESVNLSFFRDNAIPAMAVLVSGGALTEESFNKIESYFTAVKGEEAQNRIVVLEATSDSAEVAGIDGSIAAPKIDIKPMLSERQNEGLFKDYISTGGDKVRQSMRLPPIYIGHASEYNRASAFASMQTAEQQVFIPERFAWDSFVNDILFAGYSFTHWRVISVQPSYNDPQEMSIMLSVLGREGALTPNVCIQLANRFLSTTIESIEDEWGDMPFAATVQALNRGNTVEGFDYLMNQFADAAQQGDPDNREDDDDDEGEPPRELQKGVSLMLDEIAEMGMRSYADALSV